MLSTTTLRNLVVNRAHPLCPDYWWKVLPHLNFGGARFLDLVHNSHLLLTSTTQSPTQGFSLQAPPNGYGSISIDGTNTCNVIKQDLNLSPNAVNTSNNVSTNPWSVCAWINTSHTFSPTGVVIGDYNTATSGGWIFGISSTNQAVTLAILNSNASAGFNVRGTITVNNGVWRHITATFDGTDANGIKLYVDGILDSVTVITNSSPTGFVQNNLMIGDNAGTTHRHFFGQVDDVRVYRKNLSLNDVQYIWQNSREGCPGLFVGKARVFSKVTPNPTQVIIFHDDWIA